ncbi:MAG TPA: immunoglobulin domain-containing protein, partial [Candidatus Acidoferrales bacterium]
HFILDVNLTAHTYNASVVVNGAPVAIGTNLAFRTEQAGVSSVNNLAAVATLGSQTICNVKLSAVSVAPSITTQPLSQTVTAGQAATFSAAGTGTAPMSYQWQKNGIAISGATSSTYQTPPATASDNGSLFTVVMSNSAGSATSSGATLTVKSPAVAPSITAQPLGQTVTPGQTATFSVAATGTAPMSYQWRKNGAGISGATGSAYQTPATTTSDNGSLFTVVVSNSAGSVTSNSATLMVTSPACVVSSGTWTNSALPQVETGMFRLEFDATPASTGIDGVIGLSSGPASAYTSLAAIVRFNSTGMIDARNGAAYTAAAAIRYSAGTSYHFILDVNLTAHTYNASVVVNGAAVAVGTNLAFRTEQAGVSSVSNLATVTALGSQTICNVKVSAVSVAPSITTQPSSQTVTAGQAATFSVAGTGTAPLSYQWQKNGVAISGATSSTYQTPPATASDNGSQFTVVLSNSAGSVTSSSGTLTVNTGTFLLAANPMQVSFGSVNVSSDNVQNVMVTNSGTSNVTISGVLVSGAGFNAGGGIAGLILSPGQAAPLSVTFAPAAAGSVSGSVTVKSNATNSPMTIALTGTGVAQTHLVDLRWTASTSSVLGYNVYSSRVSGGPYAKLNSTPVTTTSYTDTTVQSGQTYFYVTTAVASSGGTESGFSAEASAVIP